MPLGTGFRKTSTPAACCASCIAEPKCAFFAWSPPPPRPPRTIAYRAAHHPGWPAHNCWLKSTAGTPKRNTGRVSGGCGKQPLPPAPAPGPAPSPGPHSHDSDACFDPAPPSTRRPPWCNTSLPTDSRVASLVAALSISEKITQISTFTPGTVSLTINRQTSAV